MELKEKLKVADEVWYGTALLQKENPGRDFSVREIVQKIVDEFSKMHGWMLRPGVIVHANLHCVANKQPNPNTLCYLFETKRGKRRLFKKGDQPHQWRQNGKTKPDISDMPESYPKKFKDFFKELLEWYDKVYNK